MEFWKEVVSKGRIAEWLVAGGGLLLCVVGGLYGFLGGEQIAPIFLAIVSAVFGIETINKTSA